MTHDHRLETRNLGAGYEKRVILEDVSLTLPAGKITAIVGGNASGKSTLLRTLARVLQPKSGAVLLDGQSVHQMKSRKLAQAMGLLPQSPVAPEGIAVADLVGRGRHPHQGLFSRWSAEDDRAVARALAATGTEELAERDLDTLSGARVRIALGGESVKSLAHLGEGDFLFGHVALGCELLGHVMSFCLGLSARLRGLFRKSRLPGGFCRCSCRNPRESRRPAHAR